MSPMTRLIRHTIVAAAVMLLALSGMRAVPAAAAASAAPTSTKIDAVLVLDVSNSMSKSDPGKIGNEAMKMFIDMLSVSGDQVGIVAYTDKIEREKALLQIRTPADKGTLKDFIDQLNRGAYTDVAVGMKEAVQILKDGAEPGHEPMIILLADGNNDFDDNSGRTEAQSEQERDQALADAKAAGIPVHTIGLNADGKLNKDALAQMSESTGGKSFSTDTADDLPQILSEIFASRLQLNVVPIDSFTADGTFQNVKISVPNANVLEANISVMSAKPVEAKLLDPAGAAVAIPSDNVLLSKSKSYSLIKLLKPSEGDWTLQIKGVKRDKIDINLIFNYDLTLAMDPLPSAVYSKGDSVAVHSYLLSGGQKLKDSEQYGNMKATLIVKDKDTGQTQQQEMENTKDGFSGTYKIADKHEYEIKVRAEEASFYRETDPVTISAKPGGAGQTAPAAPAEEKKPFPLLAVIAGVLGLLVLLAAAYFVRRYVKQASRGFVGQLVIEIRDENTGERTFPQYKKLGAFKGKFNLHQLLQLAPELKETEKIIFLPGSSDRMIVKNGSDCKIEKGGRAIDAARGLELRSGDRIAAALQQVDKTILIEYLV